MGRQPDALTKPRGETQNVADAVINWARSNSLWPMFFGLSCCFVEEATAFTSRYDISRFGSEVFRGSPRQADVLIVSGTVFKKVAPGVLRLYEQMGEPKWVISMGSCANSGGMYDVYSVVQGVDQILPVDVYIPGCPPRPEAVLHGLMELQKKIRATERPTRPIFHMKGGLQGGRTDPLVDGQTKFRDPRGPGYQGIPVRGTDMTAPDFTGNRTSLMWTPPAARITLTEGEDALARHLSQEFGEAATLSTPSSDMPTYHVAPGAIAKVLAHLKDRAPQKFKRLEDLTAVDESARKEKDGLPDFTVVYTLLDFESAKHIRLKVPLSGPEPAVDTATAVWPSASWYEREVYDMFGLGFTGHPDLRRLIMPHDWPGHPLRKSHPYRATSLAPYTTESARKHVPLDAGAILTERRGPQNFLINLGPHHYSTHGVIRYIVELHGEEIRAMDTEIGYHHRAVEKVAERQSWHQFIPYTDRVDYLTGVCNNLTYLSAVETLCGLKVPDRAQYIRVMLSEFFRLANHLLWFGTLVQDLGMMSAIFYAFREREMIMDIVEMITGARLHPAWLRIGGTAMDLPDGWKEKVDAFVAAFPARIKEYEAMFTHNPIFRARMIGVGRLSRKDAMEWGVTGANLRASGLDWDLRKKRPYAAYEAFDFDIPVRGEGDCYARYLVRMEEMRQSLRIIEQAARDMPPGRVMAEDARYCLPDKTAALHDIESLIHHFVNVTRGPKIPRGEAYFSTEHPRGEQGFYVASDGGNAPYRLHVRSPGFACVQAMPLMALGASIPDFVAVIGSIDYILPEIDR